MSETAHQPTPFVRLDAAALRHVRQRLQAAAQAPWLHGEVARRMADRIALIKQAPQRVLDWSEDVGELPTALRQACPQAQLSRVMPAGMAAPAQAWWRRWAPPAARAPLAVALDAVPAQAADLVWSNMRLHLEADPPASFRAWRQALAPQGFVMFSTLGPGSLGLLRRVYAELGWGPAHGPLVDMHDLGDMMVEAGLADPVMDQESLRLTYTDPTRLLAELRGLGGNVAPDRFAGCRTPRWRQRLLQALQCQAGPDGRITLELELVYGHAFRAPDRGPQVAANTHIALDDMKSMLRRAEPRR